MCQDFCDNLTLFDAHMKSLEQSVAKQLNGKVKKLEDKLATIKSQSDRVIQSLISDLGSEKAKRLTAEKGT